MCNWEVGAVFPPGEGTGEMKKEIIESMTVKYCQTGSKNSLQETPTPYLINKDIPFI